jgi:hypothetical protein
MSPKQFAYWLQGYAELNHGPPSEEQWQSIREHLALVFKKVTPEIEFPDPPGKVVKKTHPHVSLTRLC